MYIYSVTVYFFFKCKSFLSEAWNFNPLHIFCRVRKSAVASHLTDHKNHVFLNDDRKVAWGSHGGGVFCDQTTNRFSLIKKETETRAFINSIFVGSGVQVSLFDFQRFVLADVVGLHTHTHTERHTCGYTHLYISDISVI